MLTKVGQDFDIKMVKPNDHKELSPSSVKKKKELSLSWMATRQRYSETKNAFLSFLPVSVFRVKTGLLDRRRTIKRAQ